MASNPPLTLLTETEFRASRYGDVADSVNAKLSSLIAQAEGHVENHVDRRLSLGTYTERHPGRDRSVFTRQYPVRQIVAIRRRVSPQSPWEAMDVAAWDVPHPDIPQLVYGGLDGLRPYELEVTYEAGYDPIPEIIKAAVILQTVIFANVDIEVYGIGDGKEPGILYLQRQIEDYLGAYKRLRRFY